ncbi:MAG: 2-C-methyl-D-erythritol 2,4-cyclodiphosphate synthase, partial [Acidimicrobiia bacterium]
MSLQPPVATTRVGWGFDAHALNDRPPLLLGGVSVSDTQGLRATSDGDVLAHAITDAIL